jgi:anti-sigma regulatory factor (Ser/Thr protein kinase)
VRRIERIAEAPMPQSVNKVATGELDERIVSDPVQIAPVRLAVERLAADSGFDAKAVGEVGLCVNEAIANVIRHAYGGKADRPIHVRAHFDAKLDQLDVLIRDWGKGINPDTLPVKPKQLDPLLPGGLGLICLKQMMTAVVFTPQPDGMLLTMSRRRG